MWQVTRQSDITQKGNNAGSVITPANHLQRHFQANVLPDGTKLELNQFQDLYCTSWHLHNWISLHLSSLLQNRSIKVLLELQISVHVEFNSKALADTAMYLTLISTWLKVFPLYTPTMEPTISGRMTMSLR